MKDECHHGGLRLIFIHCRDRMEMWGKRDHSLLLPHNRFMPQQILLKWALHHFLLDILAL